ncbi:heterogeneous nuclear ribonucleoprotein H-like [Macrosteles quadrilineatus]|uniref:heterogeneous nuclear ribonucleoprotein H-like n=1 Tax=Macrosteles quadrilineatus TaxID=74068 RepID=UPI0023E25532|nr:heterogeneous nuclear ribonucleoprotein H-like [Macrosteles quadrilineatus]XP_054267046.1 heterogeneous nuclear ribonucleoprotein H-like [Macrosteles quadrilineatus]
MSGDHDEEGCVVKMRGLPWSTTVEEILKFFGGCNIKGGKLGIQMTMSREGRPSGEAYVEMETEEDVEMACKKDREHMGHRYIEVFRAKRSEMDWVVKRSGLNMEHSMDDGCVRLRGLPFGCTKEEIANFFAGLEIVPNGIILPTDYNGRSTGEAYVQFVNKDVAEKGLQKHKEKIGHRYIEIFRSSLAEIRSAGPKMRPMVPGGFNQRPAPYDRSDRFGGINRYGGNMGPMSRPSRNFKGYGDFDDGGWEGNGPWSNGNGPRGMQSRGGPKGGPYGGGMNNSGGWNNSGQHSIHMRGLPFRAQQTDIADFFRPVNPVNIRIVYDDNGRPSGEADVEFASHDDALRAMSKDKSHMQHRYIELFLNSTPGGGGYGMGSKFRGGGYSNSSSNNLGFKYSSF